jgi:anti-anti-sigma factor
METTMEAYGSTIVLAIEGRVAGNNTFRLCAALDRLRKADYSVIVADLSLVPFLDSIALGSIVYVGHNLEKDGKKLVLARPNAQMRELLEDMGVTDWLQVVDNYDSYTAGIEGHKIDQEV